MYIICYCQCMLLTELLLCNQLGRMPLQAYPPGRGTKAAPLRAGSSDALPHLAGCDELNRPSMATPAPARGLPRPRLAAFD